MDARNTTQPARTVSRETIGLALGTLGVVIFGGTLPATRVALATLSPRFVTNSRAAMASLAAAALLLVLRKRFPRTMRRHCFSPACFWSSASRSSPPSPCRR
ncbi:hypothetical protein [Aminobacter sp. NyZ550]|uniref:hypothetical protein n=1 Tax=Aminobacter sp. NyZ550 TaxID=2979870 RepID=UPI002F4001E9